MTTGLTGRGLTLQRNGRTILDAIDIDVAPGRVTAVIGPNGAGKSTLLQTLTGDLVPDRGMVTVNGRPLASWRSGALARIRAVLPQTPELAFHFRVWEVVELGRHPHRGIASAADDGMAVADAMRATETAHLTERDCSTLSGGERHRTHYARTLAQLWRKPQDGETRLLLLDEPTAGLDLFHQHAILAKAREVAADGVGVLAILHDLNLAARYADTLVVLANGHVEACGSPTDVLTVERIARIWRVACDIVSTDQDKLHIVILGRTEKRLAPKPIAKCENA